MEAIFRIIILQRFHSHSKHRWHLFGRVIKVNQASETKLATAPGSGIELSAKARSRCDPLLMNNEQDSPDVEGRGVGKKHRLKRSAY